MTTSSTLDLDALYPYILEHSLRDDPLLKALREESARDPQSQMQVSPEQGQFLALLVKLSNSKRIIEVGTYTGYSSLCMARALPADGYLLCCDYTKKWTDIAERYWREAKVQDRIELKLAPAARTLKSLVDEGQAGSFDMAFIDANKEGYEEYYEYCLELIKAGGLIVLDNTLWGGQVLDAASEDADTQAIRALNKKLVNDERVDLSLVPMADGVTLARKR